jgi:ribosome-associated protein
VLNNHGHEFPMVSGVAAHVHATMECYPKGVIPYRMASTETRRMVLAAAAACEDKKAENTRILELDPMDSSFTDFFLITSGNNERQTVAIADEIEGRLKRDFGTYPTSVEGRRQGEWVLMDYVDFVVHVFVTEKRAFYDIERLRKSARAVDVAELNAALTEKVKAARKRAASKPAAAKGLVAKKVTGAATKTAASGKSAKTAKKSAKKAVAKKVVRQPRKS